MTPRGIPSRTLGAIGRVVFIFGIAGLCESAFFHMFKLVIFVIFRIMIISPMRSGVGRLGGVDSIPTGGPLPKFSGILPGRFWFWCTKAIRQGPFFLVQSGNFCHFGSSAVGIFSNKLNLGVPMMWIGVKWAGFMFTIGVLVVWSLKMFSIWYIGRFGQKYLSVLPNFAGNV